MKHPKLFATAILAILACGTARADFIAYDVTNGLVGNQSYGGALGLDFSVGSDAIDVTQLGVFDSGGDGLASDKTVYLYDRDAGSIVSGSLTTVLAGSGTLINGSRFVDIAPVTLHANGHYSVVVEGFSVADPNYNSTLSPGGLPSTLNTGGLISFDLSRYGPANSFPDTTLPGFPSNVFAAGTFNAMLSTTVPEPGSIALFAIGTIGLLGGIITRRKQRAA